MYRWVYKFVKDRALVYWPYQPDSEFKENLWERQVL
jgi:hypothetical protein